MLKATLVTGGLVVGPGEAPPPIANSRDNTVVYPAGTSAGPVQPLKAATLQIPHAAVWNVNRADSFH